MENKLRSIVSNLLTRAVFGAAKLIDVQPDVTAVGAQFASSIAFHKVTVEGTDGVEEFHLAVKLQLSDPAGRTYRDFAAMFHNEVTMYREILPALGVDEDLYPKMYYGKATLGSDPDFDVVVLENLKYKNFGLSKTKLFLDYDHISLAIKKLAEIHSLSYKAKHENLENFLQLTKKLRILTLPEGFEHQLEAIIIAAIERGISPLLKKNIGVDVYNQFLTLMKNPFNVANLIRSVDEPFGVICHGDFCNNNVLYRFDNLDKPVDIVFLDFQTALYTSPVIDLSFYLYMHTTDEFREKHWDEILKLYWDTLRNNVSNDIDIPCFQDFLNHFAERAVHGYFICSLFLPAMVVDSPVVLGKILSLTLEEKVNLLTSQGGDEAERLICDIALHLLRKGYIDSFLGFCKKKNFQ